MDWRHGQWHTKKYDGRDFVRSLGLYLDRHTLVYYCLL
jgi:hypothetical protein